MNRRTIGFMACRIMALAAWFYSLVHLDGVLQLIYWIKRAPEPEWGVWTWNMAAAVLPLVASLAAGVVMWVAAGAMGRMLVPRTVESDVPSPVQASDALSIAAMVIGLLLLAWSLSVLSNGLGEWAYLKASGDTSLIRRLSDTAVTNIIVGGVQLIVGLAMLFGSRAIARGLMRLRGTGVVTSS